MCLGVPGRVVEILAAHNGQIATVEVRGIPRPVNIDMLDEPPTAGSWVLVHLGFAMDVLSEDEVQDLLRGLALDLPDEPPGPWQVNPA